MSWIQISKTHTDKDTQTDKDLLFSQEESKQKREFFSLQPDLRLYLYLYITQ
jgi:hypothetical protein